MLAEYQCTKLKMDFDLFDIIMTVVAAIACVAVAAMALHRRRRDVEPEMDDRQDIRDRQADMVLQNLYFGFSCIESKEHFRRSLLRLSAQNKREELHDRLSHGDIDGDLSELYGTFDRMFLELYPDFTGNLSRLLPDDEQLPALAPGTLNSELRVLALMKLGDGDIKHIAKVLHLTVATVYNYRSKYRGKIRCGEGETFESVVRRL